MGERLQGRIALISGAASGIGEAQARLYAQEGAAVTIGDIQDELGESVAREIIEAGGKTIFRHLDVTDLESWKSVVVDTVTEFGKLTNLVNNAGIFHPGGVETETGHGWAKMIAVNQTGVFFGMKACLPELKKTGNGAIVNISSLYALMGSPDALSYHASKGAVRVMSKAAALEMVDDNIRVNTIFPGQVETPILGDITPEMDAAIKAVIPMHKIGQPEDIAYGSLYLASDEAKYVTGAELWIDGGWHAT